MKRCVERNENVMSLPASTLCSREKIDFIETYHETCSKYKFSFSLIEWKAKTSNDLPPTLKCRAQWLSMWKKSLNNDPRELKNDFSLFSNILKFILTSTRHGFRIPFNHLFFFHSLFSLYFHPHSHVENYFCLLLIIFLKLSHHGKLGNQRNLLWKKLFSRRSNSRNFFSTF